MNIFSVHISMTVLLNASNQNTRGLLPNKYPLCFVTDYDFQLKHTKKVQSNLQKNTKYKSTNVDNRPR